MAEADEKSPYDLRVDNVKKSLERRGKTAVIPSREVIEYYVMPLLDELRAEYSEGFAFVQDQLDRLDIPDEDVALLKRGKDLILMLGNLMDHTVRQVGWVKDGQLSVDFPAHLRTAYEQVIVDVKSWSEDFAVVMAARADEDDEDDGEEGEGEEASNGAEPAQQTEAQTGGAQ